MLPIFFPRSPGDDNCVVSPILTPTLIFELSLTFQRLRAACLDLGSWGHARHRTLNLDRACGCRCSPSHCILNASAFAIPSGNVRATVTVASSSCVLWFAIRGGEIEAPHVCLGHACSTRMMHSNIGSGHVENHYNVPPTFHFTLLPQMSVCC